MTRTEELLFRASTCDRMSLTSDECKQLVELAVLQHEALKWAAEVDSAYDGEPADELTEAIAAFNRFEKGGK